MKIIKDTILLKSAPEYYEKESTGYKNNTVRTLKSIEEDGYTVDQLRKCEYIIVRNCENERQFEKEISDISVFEGIVIISWYSI